MNNFIKKNWFISIIVVILALSSCYYIYDTNKGKLKGKSKNGDGVLYTINQEDTTATDLFDTLLKETGMQTAYVLLQKAVVEQAIETTEQMKENAAHNAVSLITDFKKNNPINSDEKLDKSLQQLGYSGQKELENYLIDHQKLQQLVADFAKTKTEELKIRNISYILIKHQGDSFSQEMTEDEKERMKAVDDELLANGNDFAATAQKYSEDPTSAPNGGTLGTIDKNTANLDANFLNTALALNDGEVSEWIHSNQFGYFKIKANATTVKTLEALANNPYIELISSYDTSLVNLAIWEKAQALGINFAENTELEQQVKAFMGITDNTNNTSDNTEEKK